MNLDAMLYDQFVSEKMPPEDYINILLQRKNNDLSKFLLKEFDKKKCKFDIDKFDADGKCIIYRGKQHDWWISDTDKGFKRKDYHLTLRDGLFLVATKTKK